MNTNGVVDADIRGRSARRRANSRATIRLSGVRLEVDGGCPSRGTGNHLPAAEALNTSERAVNRSEDCGLRGAVGWDAGRRAAHSTRTPDTLTFSTAPRPWSVPPLPLHTLRRLVCLVSHTRSGAMPWNSPVRCVRVPGTKYPSTSATTSTEPIGL